MQAERKSSTSTHIPDLDNANVGTYKIFLKGDDWHLLFIYLMHLKKFSCPVINL